MRAFSNLLRAWVILPTIGQRSSLIWRCFCMCSATRRRCSNSSSEFLKTGSVIGPDSAGVGPCSVGVWCCSVAECCNADCSVGRSAGTSGISAVRSTRVSFLVAGPTAPQCLSGSRLLLATGSSFGVVAGATCIAGRPGRRLVAIGGCDRVLGVEGDISVDRVGVP